MKHLFVCGAGRSGTTFLWKILNNSPSVNLATEVHYFSSLYHNGFLHNYKKLKRKTGRVSLENVIHCLTEGNHFGMYWEKCKPFTDQEIRSYFNAKDLTDRNIYHFLVERDLLRSGKLKKNLKYIGEKTPLNIFHTRRLFKWFPDSKVLFLYRNPIDVLKSEVNKKSKPDYLLGKDNPLYPYGIVVFVFFEWLLATLIAFYNNSIHKCQFIIVSYEKLNSNQRASLRRICSAINIDYDENMCVFKKLGSSYQNGKEKTYWYPPKLVSLIYGFFLNPLSSLLNRVALNAKHVL